MKRILTLLISILILACCSKSTEPEKTPAGYKRVSLTSSERFSGDLAALPGYADFGRTPFRTRIDTPTLSALYKEQALIDFKEARVIVTNNFEAYRQLLTWSQGERMCQFARADANAYYGKDLADWPTFSAAMNRYSLHEVVYTSTLERRGDFVEGEILVKPGNNMITVCFINSQDRIFWVSAGSYLYLSEIMATINPGDTTQIQDGWEADSAGKIWSDLQYVPMERLPDPPTFPHPILSELGYLSPAMADTMCTYYSGMF